MKEKKSPDFFLFLITISLIFIGIVMIFSASSIKSARLPEFSFDPSYFLKRQTVWGIIGLVAMFVVMGLDLRVLKRLSPYFLILSWVALGLVLVPGIGTELGGARRWLSIGGISAQPSEFAKLALILYLANFLAVKRTGKKSFFEEFLPGVLVIVPSVVLIELEPDMGTAVLLGVTGLSMLFIAGARISYMIGISAAVFLGGIGMIFSKWYRLKRIFAFLDPWKDPQGSGYHIIQSLLALGAGGLWGVGLGKSKQKFFYLPEQHTDYIFAIIGEELGLVGSITILVLLFFLCYRAFKTFKNSQDIYFTLLSGGIASMFSVQILLNLGVVTNLLPPTGVPLPFLSFGGSSLICNLIAIGILLNISRHNPKHLMEKAVNEKNRSLTEAEEEK